MKKHLALILSILFFTATTFFILSFMYKYECTNTRLGMLCLFSGYGYIQAYIFYEAWDRYKKQRKQNVYEITKQGSKMLSIDEGTTIVLDHKPNQVFFNKIK